jgi:acyl-CoA synthetase (AMP-forming)/AMP-acid ligase II
MDRFGTTLTAERIREWTPATGGTTRSKVAWTAGRRRGPIGSRRSTAGAGTRGRPSPARSERVAHGLAAAGIEPGTPVSCQLPNWNEVVLVVLAAARLGAVLNPFPPIYRARELRFILGLLESPVLVVPEAFRGFRYGDLIAGLRQDLPQLRHVFVARGTPEPGMRAFAELTETAWETRAGRRPLAGSDPNRVAEIIFTSGTTGEPKGVMHTRNTVFSALHPLVERLGCPIAR